MDRVLIEKLVEKHEGRRHSVYKDTVGRLTIGVGWNLDDSSSETICEYFGFNLADLKNGTQTLNDAQIDEVFDHQISATISDAMGIFPNFVNMPDNVQAVVCDLIFNLGETRFSKFVSTIAQLKLSNWQQAADDLTNSLWFRQVGNRGIEDVALLRAA
jgi:lysozyme